MSKAEGFMILNTQKFATNGDGVLKDDQPKAEKEARTHSQVVVRKKLADISNLPQNQGLLTKEKSQSTDGATWELLDQLQKENMALLKMVAQKNKIIEQRGTELDILRVTLLKMQQQNQQLALSSSQMLGDLNSTNDQLKVLQHELGCKNGLLNARKLELEESIKRRACGNADAEIKFQEQGGSLQEDKDEEISIKIKRSLQSCSVSSSEHVHSEKNEDKSPLVRRQSARFKAPELKPAEELNLDQDQLKVSQHEPMCNNDLLKEVELELEETTRTISCKYADAELIKIQEGGESSKQDRDAEIPTNTKRSLQSSSVSSSEQVQNNLNTENTRPFVRRQSVRLKAIELKSAEDLCETDDPITEKQSTSECSSTKNEEIRGTSEYESQELGKASLLRPSRVAAKKVQSYKEIPVKVKMRRPE